MIFLPVVERELRVTARRPYTYRTRFFAGLLALGSCAWVWSMASESQPAHGRGQLLFRFLSGVAFVYCYLAGAAVTADSVSEEKREGTLGLLFLTDLKGYDVVLGKLAATSLNALYRLFSIFPLLAIPLLLGALTLAEVGRMALVLTNTLFFSLSAGMLASALSVQERRSRFGALILILVMTAGPALFGLMLARRNVPYNMSWLLSSAVYPAVLALDAPYKANSIHYWSANAVTHLMGWGFLVLASSFARRTWQDRPAVSGRAAWETRWRDWRYSSGTARARLRRRLLDINPVLWLGARNRLKPVYVLATIAGVGVVWLCLQQKFGGSMLDTTVYFFMAYCVHTILKLWLASESCRPLAEDRRSGALEIVLSTPLSVAEITDGQALALRRQFAWPVGLVLLADLAMLAAGLREGDLFEWMLLCLGIMAMLIADLYALAWLGMWLGLTARKASRATAGNVGRVLMLPWLVFILGLSGLSWFSAADNPTEWAWAASGFALSLIDDAFWYGWAKINLQQRFRLVAPQRFQGQEGREATPPPLQTGSTAAPALAR
jgi:ABC-type transport system involved in cytochrome c biogenesis permease component